MDTKDLLSLANLANLDLSEAQTNSFSQEFSSILHYISQLQTTVNEDSDTQSSDTEIPKYYHQYLRSDEAYSQNPRYSDTVKQQIVQQMPQSKNGYLVVKSILKK